MTIPRFTDVPLSASIPADAAEQFEALNAAVGHSAGWQTPEPFNTSRALVQVSAFLAAFSGLYLTVSTVTDDKYREQFFGSVERELERAVGVRAVYLALRHRESAQSELK